MVKKPLVSIIVPAYNEQENLSALKENLSLLRERDNQRVYEIIIVDDGSSDDTYRQAKRLFGKTKNVRVLKHRANFGKTDAIITGFENSRGRYIAILDADLQYDAMEIPILLDRLEEGYDIVSGWKVGKYEKKFVSAVYNYLSRLLFRIPVHDQNAMKVMKREILESVPLRKEWHRYIVTLAVSMGFRASEKKVSLRPRYRGESKYRGKGRIVIGLLDLIAVKFQVSFMRKPMLFFGSTGGISLILGFFVGIYAIVLRAGFHHGYRPLLYLVILLILVGFLLFLFGFLAEAIASLYDELKRMERKDDKKTVGKT